MRKGYPSNFCTLIGNECNTPFMEKRMAGYLYQCKRASMEDIVDELLAIQSDRDRIVRKKMMENAQAHLNNMNRSR